MFRKLFKSLNSSTKIKVSNVFWIMGFESGLKKIGSSRRYLEVIRISVGHTVIQSTQACSCQDFLLFQYPQTYICGRATKVLQLKKFPMKNRLLRKRWIQQQNCTSLSSLNCIQTISLDTIWIFKCKAFQSLV